MRNGWMCSLVLSALATSVVSAQNAPADRVLPVTVSELFRIGGTEAPEWATLVDVRIVAFGPQGELWLTDTRGGQVLRVEPDGRSGRSVARKGRGPGEIQAPLMLTVTPDGNALVGDILNSNLQVLTADGKLVTHSAAPAISRLRSVHWLSGNQFVGAPGVYRGDGGGRLSTAPDSPDPVTRIPLVRFTVTAEPDVNQIAAMQFHTAPPHVEPLTPHAFLPGNHWHARNGRVAVADGPEYVITLLDDTGRSTTRITRPHQPRMPSRADIDAARKEARARLITADGRPRVSGAGVTGAGAPNSQTMLDRVERALRNMTHAARVPVVQGIAFDDEGRLWVARTPDVWGKPPFLDVFSTSGDYIGTTQALHRLPDAFGPAGRVAFIERDEFDTPFIVVRTLTIRQP